MKKYKESTNMRSFLGTIVENIHSSPKDDVRLATQTFLQESVPGTNAIVERDNRVRNTLCVSAAPRGRPSFLVIIHDYSNYNRE